MDPGDNTSDERLALFFNLSLDMLCLANGAGYFTRVNPAFTRTLGYTEEELYSRPYVDFVHPDDKAATLRETESIAAGHDTVQFENRYRCKDGSWKWLSWDTSAMASREGVAYAVARDITAQKEAAAVREALILKLQAALEQVRTLQGLLPICSYCHMIRDDAGTWDYVETYISRRTQAEFTHAICPHCLDQNFPSAH